MTLRREQVAAMAMMVDAIKEVVEEIPDGAPLGAMYLACTKAGIPLPLFTQIIDLMVEAGLVVRSGNLLYPGLNISGSVH